MSSSPRLLGCLVAAGAASIAIALGDASIAARAQAPAPAPQGQTTPAAPGAPPATGAPQGRGRGFGFRQPDPRDFQEHEGWTSMFDGKSLTGWEGDNNWKVEDGAITIESTCEKPTGTVYLVWKGGEAADFEMKLEMKGTGMINGGVQYLSFLSKRYNGDVRLVAAAYNAGEGNVDRYGGVPPFAETQRYVDRVGTLAERYRTMK